MAIDFNKFLPQSKPPEATNQKTGTIDFGKFLGKPIIQQKINQNPVPKTYEQGVMENGKFTTKKVTIGGGVIKTTPAEKPVKWPTGTDWIKNTAVAGYKSVEGSVKSAAEGLGEITSNLVSDKPFPAYNAQPGYSKYNADGTENPNYEKELQANKDYLKKSIQSPLKRGVAMGEGVMQIGSLAFAKVMAELEAGKQLPGVLSWPAKAASYGFEKVGQGGSWVSDKGVDFLPFSKETKDTIRPLAQELGAFIAQLLVVKVAHTAVKEGGGKIVEKLPISEKTKENINTGVKIGVGVSMQPFSTAFNLANAKILTKIAERKAAKIDITPEETKKIIEEVKVELPKEIKPEIKAEAQKQTNEIDLNKFLPSKNQEVNSEIPNDLQALAVEAKKYKNPDDFLNSLKERVIENTLPDDKKLLPADAFNGLKTSLTFDKNFAPEGYKSLSDFYDQATKTSAKEQKGGTVESAVSKYDITQEATVKAKTTGKEQVVTNLQDKGDYFLGKHKGTGLPMKFDKTKWDVVEKITPEVVQAKVTEINRKFGNKNLSPELEKMQQENINYVAQNEKTLINKYVKEKGNYLNGDFIKDVLFDEYKKDKGNYQAFQAGSNYLWGKIIDKFIAENHKVGDGSVAWLIGGQASGKSTSMEAILGKYWQKKVAFVVENPTIQNVTQNRILNANYPIDVFQVATLMQDGAIRAVERGKSSGRVFPIESLIDGHQNAKQKGIDLVNNPVEGVFYHLIDNTGARENIHVVEGKDAQLALLSKLGYNENTTTKSEVVSEYKNLIKQKYENNPNYKEVYRVFTEGLQNNGGIQKTGQEKGAATGGISETGNQGQSENGVKTNSKENQPLPKEGSGFVLPARDVAKKLIEDYVKRGDTFESLKGSYLGGNDAMIGGYANGKGVGGEKIVVKSIDGKELPSPQVFSLREIYDEVKKEEILPAKQATGLPVIKPVKITPESKIAELTTQIDQLQEVVDSSPLKKLSRFESKMYPGELPEITGKEGKGKYNRFGDSLSAEVRSELGLGGQNGMNDNELSVEFGKWAKARNELRDLKLALKVAKGDTFIDYTSGQLNRINKLFQSASDTLSSIKTLKPVGTGEVKTSGLAQGVEAKAVKDKLTKGFGDLPQYNEMNIKEQTDKALELLKNDPEKAYRVAMGQESSPEGLHPESVFIALEDKATREGDVATLRDLANSTLTSEATAMGQRIRTLAERSPDSPVGAIREVQKVREDVANKKYKDIGQEKQNIKSEIKSEIKKVRATKETWQSFIKSLQC